MSTHQIFFANYGFHVSSSHATPSQETDYAGVSEAAGFQPLRSVTISMDHDIIDGAPATRFASRLKELIESGYGLIDQDSVSKRSNSITDA
jgi:pyruvate/2-oxoglutarate dehydrogenase complex dihydrolipoamide acyltransferase (E2) component